MENTGHQASPKLSVILPSLNVSTYIRQCIESVCAQTLREIEILCIDAGSTDGTLEIIQEFAEKDDRIQVIHSDIKSYGHQVNCGIKRARGEYVGIIETDDYADPDMFEKLYRAATANGVEVVKSNFYFHAKDTDDFFEQHAGLPYETILHPKQCLSLFMRHPAIWTGLYKKSFLMENDVFFLETPGASYQDMSFILKVWMAAEKIYLLKEAFLHYRIDNAGSSINSKGKMLCVCDEMKAAHEYMNRTPERREAYERIIWDREAGAYYWNVSRLSDELKYDFLSSVQSRFQEGLKRGVYQRQHLQWSIWKMVLEVAEDPLIYLQGRMDADQYEKLLSKTGADETRRAVIKRCARKDKLMGLPQTLCDLFSFAHNYGLRYCIRRTLKLDLRFQLKN